MQALPNLEERYKDRGLAKIRNGEFILQDLDNQNQRIFNLLQPWRFIMAPGKKRYISITFRDAGTVKQSCPHCKSDNEMTKGKPTEW
jgi:hypothetical protein